MRRPFGQAWMAPSPGLVEALNRAASSVSGAGADGASLGVVAAAASATTRVPPLGPWDGGSFR